MKTIKSKMWYVLGWTIYSVMYEWIFVESGLMYYNGWKLWYSALCYPFIIIVLAWNATFVRTMVYEVANQFHHK
jgi:hypothetical protein